MPALVIGIILSGILDVIGLGVVLPVIELVTQPDGFVNSTSWIWFSEAFPQVKKTNSNELLIWLCSLTILLFGLKGIFHFFMAKATSSFSFGVAHRLTGALWDWHFDQGVFNLRTKSTGQILTEINQWPIFFADLVLGASFILFAEILTALLISVALICFVPKSFLFVAGILGIGTLVIRFVTSHRLNFFSNQRKELEPKSNAFVSNAVRGVIELLSMRAIQSTKKQYLADHRDLLSVHQHLAVYYTIPSKFFEFLSVGTMMGLIILGAMGLNLASATTVSMMVLAAYRIMPSMSRVNSAIINIQSSDYLIQALSVANEFANQQSAKDTIPTRTLNHEALASIKLTDISAGYEDNKNVFDKYNITFEGGKITALVGPSGSGKSTLLHILLGILKPHSGIIEARTLSGTIVHPNSSSWFQHFGYLPQSPFFFKGTVSENLTCNVPGRSVNTSLLYELIEKVGLTGVLGKNPAHFLLNEESSNLSGGQQQRLALIRAILLDRPVLILDEATSALDSSARERVFELIKEEAKKGKIVILVTHDDQMALQCDSTVRLHD